MTWSWLFSWPVALVGFVASVIGIGLFAWAFYRWARQRIREWRWAREDARWPANPFTTAACTFDPEGFKGAYGLTLPGTGLDAPN